MCQPLDSAMPGRPPNVPFFGQERYVFMFLCEKNCACGHGLMVPSLSCKVFFAVYRGKKIALRARREHVHLALRMLLGSFSQKRQHDDMVAAAF